MKYRCQCGKPEYATVRESSMPGKTVQWNEDFEGEPTLHFKAATMFCERCGTPICEKCTTTITDEVESYFYPDLMVYRTRFVCHACAELESER